MCFVACLFNSCAKRNPKKFVCIGHPLSVTLMLVTIVTFFLGEMLYIAPRIFGDVGYKVFWLVIIFITYNILGNMWACYRTKSTVATLPEDRRVPKPGEEHLWHFCDTCQAMMPPRSWHCKLCECCILKRDHHCLITATCIGHNNQRYFFWFTFFLSLGTIINLVTLIVFMSQENMTIKSPAVWLLHLYVYAFYAALVMWSLQLSFMCRNTTCYDDNEDTYNLGWRENFALALGKRGFWTMLSPSIKSPLPQDGTQWRIKQSV